MSDFIITVLTLLLLAVITLIATILVVAGFVGVGALFAHFTELTLFQATVVVTPVGAAALYLLGRIMSFPGLTQEDEEDEWDEWDEWDEDVDFEDLPPQARRKVLRYVSDLLEGAEAEDVEAQAPPRRRRRRR